MVRGNKINANSEGLISSNIPTFFARHGMIGINANYRLVPEVQWPSGPDDLRGILTWIRGNIDEYGGDPDAVFLMGNSAGDATLRATSIMRTRISTTDRVSLAQC